MFANLYALCARGIIFVHAEQSGGTESFPAAVAGHLQD